MKQKAYLYALFVAAFLSLIGILLFLSILGHLEQSIHAYRETELFSRPGAFLYGSFHWFSFYIPLYLFASAFLLLFRPFKSNWLLLLTLSIVPFLTFSLVIKLFTETGSAQAPLSSLVSESFGRVPAAILILVIALIETLLLVQLHGYLNRRSVSQRENMAGGREKGHVTHGEVSLADASSSLAEITDYLSEKDNDWEAKLEEARSDTEDLPLASDAEEEGLPERDKDSGTGKDAGNGNDGGNGKDAGSVLHVSEDRSLIPRDPPEGFSNALEKVKVGEIVAVEDAEFERVETDLHPVSDKPSRKIYRYTVPVNGILQDYTDAEYWKIDAETQAAGRTLMKTLEEFNISAELTGIQKGPVITMFEILPSPGVKLSRIVNLADNIALRLAALRVRIVAPIPGKHAVGIEVPNRERANVPFKEMITLDKFQKSQYAIPIVLGKDISGVAQIVDLVQTPHLLIAGATGSGKSVCVNAIICSILYKRRPDEVRLMLIDPKIVELKIYNDIPHLLTPVITDPKRSFQALQYCIYEMERRYSLLDALEVRDIHSYNRKITRKALATEPLPYIVIVIDEFADLMATSGKEMESTLARLAAMSRAVGLHLVLATQRPSVDVITGLIKANIPSRIAFMVASKFDSRIIMDTVGADKLLGQGDMLFESAWDPVPIRIQGAYLSQDEIEAITAHVRTLGEPEYIDEEIFFDDEEEAIFQEGEEDPLLDKALEIVITAGKASASYLQRRLKIGYNRAARLVEHMELRGIVGPANGSKPREILHVPDK